MGPSRRSSVYSFPRAATRKSKIIFLRIRAARQAPMTRDGKAWPFIAAAHSISYLRLAGRSTGASRSGGGLSSTLGYSPHPPRSSSAIPSPSRGGMKKPCSIASPGEPAKACKRARCAQVERSAVAHQSRGLAGHRAPRPLRKMGSHSAPRLCGDILMPMPLRLTSVPARGGLAAERRG